MAQVYEAQFRVTEIQSADGKEVLWVDASGNAKTWTVKANALNDAKVNFGNDKYKIWQMMKVDSTDEFDESG